MTRAARIQFPGAVYHVMSRGNRKSMIVDDDDDRRLFMNVFGAAADDHQVRVTACCLMGTHFHAVLDTPRGNLSAFLQKLNGEYSRAFNRRHERVGHTFEQRFKSIVVQREKYLRRVVRYIVQNPVKAGLCRDASEWPWSTHRATAGLEEAPSWLHLGWLCWAFRAETLAEAQARYQAYVRDPAGLTWSFKATEVLGTGRFKRAVTRWQGGESSPENRPVRGECRSAPPPLEELFVAGQSGSRTREELILIAHATHGYRLADIARFLALDPSTVSKAASRARGRTCRDGGESSPDGSASSPSPLTRDTPGDSGRAVHAGQSHHPVATTGPGATTSASTEIAHSDR